MMLYLGKADGVVGGMEKSLPETLRPALKVLSLPKHRITDVTPSTITPRRRTFPLLFSG